MAAAPAFDGTPSPAGVAVPQPRLRASATLDAKQQPVSVRTGRINAHTADEGNCACRIPDSARTTNGVARGDASRLAPRSVAESRTHSFEHEKDP